MRKIIGVFASLLFSSVCYGGMRLVAPTNAPHGSSLPATCSAGDIYQKTSATSGSQWYACESANTWVLQGGGGGSMTPNATYYAQIDSAGTQSGSISVSSGAVAGQLQVGSFKLPSFSASTAVFISTSSSKLLSGTTNFVINPVTQTEAWKQPFFSSLASGYTIEDVDTTYVMGMTMTTNGVDILKIGKTTDPSITIRPGEPVVVPHGISYGNPNNGQTLILEGSMSTDGYDTTQTNGVDNTQMNRTDSFNGNSFLTIDDGFRVEYTGKIQSNNSEDKNFRIYINYTDTESDPQSVLVFDKSEFGPVPDGAYEWMLKAWRVNDGSTMRTSGVLSINGMTPFVQQTFDSCTNVDFTQSIYVTAYAQTGDGDYPIWMYSQRQYVTFGHFLD